MWYIEIKIRIFCLISVHPDNDVFIRGYEPLPQVEYVAQVAIFVTTKLVP